MDDLSPKKNGADRAAKSFFEKVSKRDKAQKDLMKQHEKVVAEKDRHLIPLRQLLKKLCDAGVYVVHSGSFDKGYTGNRFLAPQALSVTEGESSPKWQPGGSLYIDHPAPLEVAVVNFNNREDDGLIVLACAEDHPHRYLLSGPFQTSEQACLALAEFLSIGTVRIDRPSLLSDDDDDQDPITNF